MVNHYGCRQWLGAVRQQAITLANVDPDLCPHMASLGLNELNTSQGSADHLDKDYLMMKLRYIKCWAELKGQICF